MTPAEIAKGLSEAQKRALLWLPAGTDISRRAPMAMHRSYRSMSAWAPSRAAGLVQHVAGGRTSVWYHLTPLGQQVRAAIEETS